MTTSLKSGLRIIILILTGYCFSGCAGSADGPKDKFNQAHAFFIAGEFKKAEGILDQLKMNPSVDTLLGKEIEILDAKIDRIRIDFSKDEQKIREELKPWIPVIDSKVLESWEKLKQLEMRYIDGEKRYFRQAANNFFRINATAKKIRNRGVDPLDKFCLKNTTALLSALDTGTVSGNHGTRFQINYSIKLEPDVVPDGETVRCWMPYPRNFQARQKNIRLLSVNSDKYYIASDSVLQRSIYIEKTAKKGESLLFAYSAEFETVQEYFPGEKIIPKPYDTKSELFRKYTSERPPHIVFSNEIRQLASFLTRDKKSPFEKVKAIFTWIDQEIPWASALEYSIMENIPHYVLENRHGDCGMKTLLFMTLARASGIPCKWQSGWMLHPGEVNLHDWCMVYYEGIGWVPLDQSFGLQESSDPSIKYFYCSGIDSYRLIVNDEYGTQFDPPRKFYRSEPVDFQRGELEWRGGNLYFDKWDYNMTVTYL